MRVTVCFQLKKSISRPDGKRPLYLRCTMSGQRFEISIGFFLDSEMWVESTQQVKGKSEEAKIIKNRLESMGLPFDIFTIRSKFLGHSNGQGLMEIFELVVKNIEATLGKDYSYGTLKHYRTTKKTFGRIYKSQGRTEVPPPFKYQLQFLKIFRCLSEKVFSHVN